MKALLDSLKRDRKYSILDLGPAIGSNIEFLTPLSSKIQVEDLYKTLQTGRFFDHPGEEVDETHFSRILTIPDDERFDILLSWDLVNYFTPSELKALIRYLGRFCSRGASLFAMASMAKEMPSLPVSFKILNSETLQYTPVTSEMRACPRYVPRDLGIMMAGFHIGSSYILRNGMQEYVFVRE